MKIAIVGAGAMGCIYGTYLSKKNDVLLVDVVQEHVDAINNKGLEFTHLDGTVEVYRNMKATTDASSYGPMELLILLTKGYQSAEALSKNKNLIGPDTIVLSLQNGYGNADEIVKFVPEEQIVLGTSGGGAIVAGPGVVKHKGQGPTHVGCMTKDQSNAEIVAKVLRESGVPDVELTADVKELVWSKVFVNIGINAICALIGDTNQCIVNNPFAKAASYQLVKEAVEVVNATGMHFDFEEVNKNVQDIAAVTGGNIASMYADVLHKRKTEVDRINGAAVSEGAKVGKSAPLNELITNLIHAKEELY
jgi:2-dehydropantoate 2-reductase